MRIRSLLLPAMLLAPLALPLDDALGCIRFKKPGGAVPPGLREPSDPPPPPTPTPTTPTPMTDPGSKPPTTGDPTPGGEGPRRKAANDDSTWETWWALNRIEFFPHRYVTAAVSTEGPVLKGAKPLSAEVVRAKLWKPLMALKDDKQAFVREAALITIGRVASDESLKAEARAVLIEAIRDENHLVARAAALGLFYVGDETSILPMAKLAEDPKAESDLRAFLAVTMTAMGSDMAGPLLMRMVSSDKSADFELVSAALMGLGFVPGPESARFLTEVYENKKFRAELRAMALESFGRRGNFEEGWKLLAGALDDREIHIRRSAAIALGVLDYRTQAEREIDALVAPYDTSTGAGLPADVTAKVAELKKLIPAQREATHKPVREVVKKLVHTLENDNDGFVSSMCAISLGRIAAQADEGLAVRRLEADLKKERNNVREYEMLALAIAKAPSTLEIATSAVEGKNRMPTTQAAGMVALGILGDPKGAPVLMKVLEESQHPVLRGYAAMALGILGSEDSHGPMLSMLKTTKSPDAMSFGALGLAMLGKRQGSELLIRRLSETTNGDVAAFNVYALGLMKDRSKLDDLIKVATSHDNHFVQSAAVAAIGYVSSSEDYPRRHLMARGFNYLINLPLLENFFYKL
ncbi:MAG TPA: hypothetical protein VND21_11670 [Planctomycetota bacterium]|nr:hypothetical protein [Planctomycetota bacterium]